MEVVIYSFQLYGQSFIFHIISEMQSLHYKTLQNYNQLAMSIYSGFATRNQQKYYDKVLYNVISTLMVRIVKFYKSETIQQKAFRKIVKDQHKVISKLQKHKYVDPKYAELLEHFMRVLDKSLQQKSNQHLEFQLRRKSIEENSILNRTLSGLGNEITQLQSYTDKIDTLDFDDLNSDRALQLIPEKRRKEHTKKKRKQPRSNSIQSNIDIWEVRKQKLPEIPNLLPISQTILNRTRFHNHSQKMTNKTVDEPALQRNTSNQKILDRAPKFKSKVFFKGEKYL